MLFIRQSLASSNSCSSNFIRNISLVFYNVLYFQTESVDADPVDNRVLLYIQTLIPREQGWAPFKSILFLCFVPSDSVAC